MKLKGIQTVITIYAALSNPLPFVLVSKNNENYTKKSRLGTDIAQPSIVS